MSTFLDTNEAHQALHFLSTIVDFTKVKTVSVVCYLTKGAPHDLYLFEFYKTVLGQRALYRVHFTNKYLCDFADQLHDFPGFNQHDHEHYYSVFSVSDFLAVMPTASNINAQRFARLRALID